MPLIGQVTLETPACKQWATVVSQLWFPSGINTKFSNSKASEGWVDQRGAGVPAVWDPSPPFLPQERAHQLRLGSKNPNHGTHLGSSCLTYGTSLLHSDWKNKCLAALGASASFRASSHLNFLWATQLQQFSFEYKSLRANLSSSSTKPALAKVKHLTWEPISEDLLVFFSSIFCGGCTYHLWQRSGSAAESLTVFWEATY